MPTTSQNLVSSEASVTAKNQPNTKKIKVNDIIKDLFGKPLDDIAISIKIDSSNVPLKNGLLKNGKFTIEVPHDSQLKFIVFDYESQVLQAKEKYGDCIRRSENIVNAIEKLQADLINYFTTR